MVLERLGPYQIVGKLGRGGMGTVYEGVHRETGESAAIKLLSAGLAQEEGFRARFEGEIETLRKLNHPNIARLFGFGQQEDQLYYAMELVDGNSLEEELKRGRRFEWPEVARIGAELCRALRHAHDRGIIHRDIKPGNLLLATDGRVKLSDFGIARLFGNTRLTSAGGIVGTAEYMSPEQAEGKPVDARSDLYSLGVLLYAILARRPVFRGKSFPDLLHKQRFETPEPVRKFAPDVPEEFEAIISQLLEKDPSRRIANAGLLGRRLEAMLQALWVNRETLEADADWLLRDDTSSPAAKLTKLTDYEVSAPTIDRASIEMPATEERIVQDAKQTQEPLPHKPATVAAPAETVPDTFIPVSEEELDSVEEAPWRPAYGSWQFWALVVALVCVWASVLWFIQEPTADALFSRIEARTADGSPESLRAAEVDIKKFLNLYTDDPNARKMQEYMRRLDLDQRERRIERHLRGLDDSGPWLPIEQVYSEAKSYLRSDPPRAAAKFQALIDLYQGPGEDAGPTTGQYIIGAKRHLEVLGKEVAKYIADQLDLLSERFDAAAALQESEPEQARKIYRAIVELYGDKPWAADIVGRAREALKNDSMLTKPAAPEEAQP